MTQLTKPTLEKQIDALVEMRERFLVMAITYKVGDQFDGDFQSIEDAIESLRELAALSAQQSQEPIGEVRENGVTWFGPNPHAHPVGTKFYAAPSSGVNAGLPVEPEYLIRLRNALKGFKSDGAFAGDKDIVEYIDTLRAYAVQMKAENEKWQERVFEFDTCIQEVADELGACCGGVDGDQADPLSTTQVLLKAICHIKQRAEKAEAILIQHYCDYEFKPTLEQAVELMLEERREKKATEAENAALRKDAERYRFLRKQHEFDDDQASNNNYGKNYPPRTMCVFQDDGSDGLEPVKCDPGALDKAIDRARSAK